MIDLVLCVVLLLVIGGAFLTTHWLARVEKRVDDLASRLDEMVRHRE